MTEIEEMGFEESIKALEEMVKKLEAGGLDLDESLKVYEDAVKLRDHCRKILEESDRKVQKIMETANGPVKEDLDIND
ncbi:MAG: exodeoxyribonuclease VII small subunit [Candidatus Methanomethylophilaceae archaeon]|mgnify:CR=1 FL=1|jgi:exodeoxyribonuclease VII small subunit